MKPLGFIMYIYYKFFLMNDDRDLSLIHWIQLFELFFNL